MVNSNGRSVSAASVMVIAFPERVESHGPWPLPFPAGTVGRVRHADAMGQLTVHADSGFYIHDIVAACREHSVRFSITVRQRQRRRSIIEAIPEAEWTPIP